MLQVAPRARGVAAGVQRDWLKEKKKEKEKKKLTLCLLCKMDSISNAEPFEIEARKSAEENKT